MSLIMSLYKINVVENKVTGMIGSYSLYDGPISQIPAHKLNIPKIVEFRQTLSERKGIKPTWQVFPSSVKNREVVHITDKAKAFWCYGKYRTGSGGVQIVFGVSVDGGNEWAVHHSQWDFHYGNNGIFIEFKDACRKKKDEFDKQVIEQMKQEKKANLKTEALNQGITVTELKKKISEEKKLSKLTNKQKKESFEDVSEMKKRLELATSLKKIEANVEFLLETTKKSDKLNIARLNQKLKSIKTVSRRLDNLVKTFNIEKK